MYADRVEAGQPKASVMERLHGSRNTNDVFRKRLIAGKRQGRDNEKWNHDLFEDAEVRVSKRKTHVHDLRLKLQKKGFPNSRQTERGSLSGAPDLRNKLSDSKHPKTVSVVVPPPVEETQEIIPSPKKKKRKSASVDGFLQNLGLEKYSITFKAEEVDMTALLQMSDVDLKALGIPMGPRKKILLALDSRV